MKNIILFAAVVLSSVTSFAAGPSRVYLLDGFFVSLPVASFYEATEKIRAHLEKNHPGTAFTPKHNSLWRGVCSDIKDLPGDQKPAHIILIGHSYGANAAMDISRCLEDQKVDLVISIDGFQKFFAGDVELVSENVGTNYNFYEDQDIALRGAQNNHREDGSYRNITNTHVPLPPSASYHYRIVSELVDRGVIQTLLDQFLQ